MCGINGFTFSNPAALRHMHAATKHRGPDDEGFFEADGISLAHNRLSIIDLSPLGRQPMTTVDGRFTIVFNGEIYNYKDLRAELERGGTQFHSQSDTEVLLALFAREGAHCLTRLNGIFAFAAWDRDTRTLTLGRDHLGVKPVYYYLHNGRLIFSSEIKGILAHADVPRQIDADALNLYFRFQYVPGPRTMFAGIHKLPAGHALTVRAGQMTLAPFWELKEGEPLPDGEIHAAVRSGVLAAVRRQLVSDRPLGVFLSGGIDSTLVLAAMRESERGLVHTFSIGYEATAEAEKYNADFDIAARTAAHFGTEHHAIRVSGRDVAGIFEEVVRHMDEPISNHVQPSTYLRGQFAKPRIAVVLGGDGGDELFGGYDRYWYHAMLGRIDRLPSALRHPALLSAAGKLLCAESLAEKAALTPGLERFLAFAAQKEERVARLLRPSHNRPASAAAAFAPHFAKPWKDGVNQIMAVDARTWLPDESLMRTDKMTMAHGLEQRVPLLDPTLAELAFRIPSQMKIGSRTLGKRVLREACADLIPDFVARQKKRGFFSPASKWLRGDLLPLAQELLSDGYAPGSGEWIDLAAARDMLDDHVAKRTYGLTQIWAVMTFQAWYRSSLS